jgi:uncharacterized phage protein (TIGR02220 family)
MVNKMPKRFTDTAIWDKAWFRKLPPRLKETWRYFCDKCDHAGILELDLEALVFNVGEGVTIEQIHGFFGDKITFISEAKIFLTGFIPFQYKCEISGLNPDNNAHKSVIGIIHKYGLDKTLTSPCSGVMDKDKELDMDIDKEVYREIVDDLNAKAGKVYRSTTAKTRTLIKARMADGFTVDDFKTVHDRKCAEWLKDEENEKYLRPETLYGNKFEGYLNQPDLAKTDRDLSQY